VRFLTIATQQLLNGWEVIRNKFKNSNDEKIDRIANNSIQTDPDNIFFTKRNINHPIRSERKNLVHLLWRNRLEGHKVVHFVMGLLPKLVINVSFF
jgi:hypothetical protein